MTAVYKLKEVAKWSVGSPYGEHRYVDIEHVTPGSEPGVESITHFHTITLPTADAQALVDAMTPKTQDQDQDQESNQDDGS